MLTPYQPKQHMTFSRILTGVVLLFSLARSSASLAQAGNPLSPSPRTIHVPGDAPTIQAAIDLARDGDLVLVAPGLYPENIQLSDKTITLASQFRTTRDPSLIDQTIIDGGGNSVITVTPSVGPGTKIIGFTIRNGDDGISAWARLDILNNRFTHNDDGIDYEAGGGICRFNVFENNRDDAIDLDGPTAATMEYNIIRNNYDDGIEIRLQPYSGPTLDIIIRRNIISGNVEDGIQLVDYPDLSDRVFRIERNLIKDSGYVGLGLMDNGVSEEDFRGASIPERIYLFNNTFADNDYGLTGGGSLIALNNIFVGSTHIAMKNVDGNSIAAYNLFWGNGTDFQNSNLIKTTTLFTDPRLDADYRLTRGSPAIDVGTAFFAWNSETVLDLRPAAYAGTAPDLGAYEAAQVYLPLIMKSGTMQAAMPVIPGAYGFGITTATGRGGQIIKVTNLNDSATVRFDPRSKHRSGSINWSLHVPPNTIRQSMKQEV